VTTRTAPAAVLLDVHPGAGDADGLEHDVREGFAREPKTLPPKYFYDDAGSRLFEDITELPEYYQTRTELRILRDVAPGIAERHALTELVELGSGASRKTEAILGAMRASGHLRRYVPFDVCPEALRAAAARLAGHYPDLRIHGVAGDFGRHLAEIPPKDGGARLVAFLGGTIGNLTADERTPFLRSVAELMDHDDRLLVGTDLAGDPERIVPAYDDAQGVTARFNLNLLTVLNREMDADFAHECFEHVARYALDPPRIEMRLRSSRAQSVRFGALGMEVHFKAGEEMLTEISCKFTREAVAGMYEDAGLALEEWHPDPRGWFAVSLARRA
jgi:L-histidine Nalpha-methyltransferase